MKKSSIAATVVALLVLLVAPAAAQTGGNATVTVLHGVPGLTVDVYANGNLLIPGFEPGAQFGPAELPAGDYAVAVRPAGAEPDSDPAIAADVTVPDGANATAVAHLDADGNPTLSTFVNDVSGLDAGNTRVTVRHTAAFGAVDVLAGGDPVLEGVTNGQESTLTVPGGTYPISVTAAGDRDTTAFSGEIGFEAGTAYFVHAIGDPTGGTFDLLVQSVGGLGTEVQGVATGSGGLAADDGSGLGGFAVAGLALVAVAVLGVPAAALTLRRR